MTKNVFLYKGRSMYPTFREGDILVVEWVRGKRVRPGDVVLFPEQHHGRGKELLRPSSPSGRVFSGNQTDFLCDSDPLLDYVPSSESSAICAHRVQRLFSGGMVTKGDNNSESDPTLVQKAQILGRVTWVKKPGRKDFLPVLGGRRGSMVAYVRRMEIRLHARLHRTLPKRFHRFLRRRRLQDLLLAVLSHRSRGSNHISRTVGPFFSP